MAKAARSKKSAVKKPRKARVPRTPKTAGISNSSGSEQEDRKYILSCVLHSRPHLKTADVIDMAEQLASFIKYGLDGSPFQNMKYVVPDDTIFYAPKPEVSEPPAAAENYSMPDPVPTELPEPTPKKHFPDPALI